MNSVISPEICAGHQVRVMWERAVGLWQVWPLKRLRRPVPIYVFLGYSPGEALPLRICLRGDGSVPFIIDDPLAYDGGHFNYGPFATASRYDDDNGGHTLAELFTLLQRWAIHGREDWSEADRQALGRALDQFHIWIGREHHRDRNLLPGAQTAY